MCECERCCPENPRYEDTTAFKLECLARSVLARSIEDRRAFLALFEQNNGAKMTATLKNEIWRLWDAQRRAAA